LKNKHKQIGISIALNEFNEFKKKAIMAEEEIEEGVVGESGKSKKKLFIIIGAAVATLIIIGAALFFTGVFDNPEPVESDVAESVATEDGDEEETSSSEEVPVGAAVLYQSLTPPFKVHYQQSGIKVVMVAVSVMTDRQAVIEAVEMHDPIIRNNILLILAAQDPELLKSIEGKRALQKLIKEDINKILAAQKIKKGITQVFFTELVMQ